jgi:hypothetical protein
MAYNVRFDFDQLQKDLGFDSNELPRLIEALFGEKVSKSGVYAWFHRERMSVERLIQILTIVRSETGVKLDVWRYIEATRPARAA